MISIRLGNYTKETAMFMAQILITGHEECTKGCSHNCQSCVNKYACEDLQRAIRFLNESFTKSE